ncbi:MAG TPA: DNA ligase D [Stellaceae bacterium]
MALTEYKRKRDFNKTPEPAGHPVAAKKKAALSFVVQKHAARRLHYDFRLELDGVLKSWAVPRGPSLDPGEKRLAVHVEDHPLEYGGFEGVIPQGQYGGGTVLLWDRGRWTPLDPNPIAAYEKGSLKFELDGEKLHGRWALVRMGGKAAQERGDNWLLIKERDDEAVPGSGGAVVEDNPLSVASGREMAQIAAERDRVWESNREEPDIPPASSKPAAKPRPMRVAGAHKAPLPDRPQAQLAKLADRPPDGPDWLHEIKYDGYRLLGRIDKGAVRLVTRNGLDWTAKFPALAERLAALPVETAVIDGEIVALNADGTTTFAGLQDKISTGHTDALIFYAFDLLYQDGWDLTSAPLEDRKAALAGIVPPDSAGMVRYSDHQAGDGPAFFAEACRFGIEGIVSKRRDKPYRPGRNDNWRKIKCANREEFVVVGFTDPAGRRQGIGALLLGFYDPKGTLHYAGRVGTGFGDEMLARLRERLDRIERRNRPVAALPKGVSLKGVHWTEPSLVAEIRYGNWTSDRILRHAAFEGLREDKNAREVVREEPAMVEPAEPIDPKTGDPGEPRARDGSMTIQGVRLTHPDRVLYPDQGITKLDLAHYYTAIADWALPHLAHRPLSLVRCPEGQGKTCFFQKHVGSGVPDQLGRVEIPEKTGSETYLVIEDLAGLVSLVQMGVLEIHPWGSTIKKLETPDRVTFDLDPDIDLPWERVADAALEMRDVLARLGLKSFAKTTGGKGLHVVVPLTPRLPWDEVKEFTRAVAMRMAEEAPERYLAVASKRSRQGRIYIDYLRNGRGATAIGAYSARARPGAPVSTPLFWEEVERAVRPEGFTVATVPARLASLSSDPWAEIGKLRQSISATARRRFGL